MKHTRKSKLGDIAICVECGKEFDLFYHYSRDMKEIKKCIEKGHIVNREMTSFITYKP